MKKSWKNQDNENKNTLNSQYQNTAGWLIISTGWDLNEMIIGSVNGRNMSGWKAITHTDGDAVLCR